MTFNKDKFRLLRESCGLTLKEIAIACNVAESSVHNWESGNGVPRPIRIPKLAELLHCAESDLAQYGPATLAAADLQKIAAKLSELAEELHDIASELAEVKS